MTQPTKLTEAVAAVMREVHRLKKDETNKHGGYKYVSVDDVKDHVRPLLGKHGLEIAISETEFSVDALQTKSGTTLSAKITYEVNVRHVSGEEGKPERITVMLPYTGAQTSGAARSYAIKEWLKGRFLVSTGEKDMIEGGADADAYAQDEYSKPAFVKPGSVHSERTHSEPDTAAISGSANVSKNAKAKEVYNILIREMEQAKTLESLKEWLKLRRADIQALPQEWMEHFDEAYGFRRSSLEDLRAA